MSGLILVTMQEEGNVDFVAESIGSGAYPHDVAFAEVLNMGGLGESSRWSIINALRVAAEKYDANAATIREEVEAGNVGRGSLLLAGQFDKQAADTRRFAERIENATHVILTGEGEQE